MFKLNFLNQNGKKSDTGKGYISIIIIILLGVGLLLLALGSPGGKGEEEAQTVASDEERLAELCSSLSGVGRCRVYIAYEERGVSYTSRTEEVIVGIAVICEGGGNDTVKARLTSLIDSLFGIGTNRIRVDELK